MTKELKKEMDECVRKRAVYNSEKWRKRYEEEKLLIAASIIEKAKKITQIGGGGIRFVKEGE